METLAQCLTHINKLNKQALIDLLKGEMDGWKGNEGTDGGKGERKRLVNGQVDGHMDGWVKEKTDD